MAGLRTVPLVVLIGATACSQVRGPSESIAIQTQTPAASIVPQSASPTHSSTIAPPPVALLTSSAPMQTQALLPEGPWVAFLTRDGHIAVADFSGPGLLVLPLPSADPPDCGNINFLTASPRGGFISFICTSDDTTPYLRIVTLPTGEVLAQLPLLGEQAIQADAARQDTFLPPPASYTVQTEPPMWSPSGRYLAYAAAPSSPSTDVHVYDTLAQIDTSLTSGPDQTMLMGWSPDSRWIVHASFLYGDIDRYVRTVWAVSADGAAIDRLYDIDQWLLEERIIGWRSATEFISARSHFEACDTDLRSTIIGGGSRVLTADGFSSASFDPLNGITVIAQSSEPYCVSSRPGIFAVDMFSASTSPVGETGYWSILWSPPLGAFIARGDSGWSIDIITSSGDLLLSLPTATDLLPSPDGRWLLGFSSQGIALLSSDGHPEMTLPSITSLGAAWHPLSTSFLTTACQSCPGGVARLQEYSYDETWQMASRRDLPLSLSSTQVTVVAK